MTNQEAISYLCNLRVAIGRTEHQALWHYEQPLAEIVDMLSEEPEIIRCRDCKWSDIDDPDFPNEYYCDWHDIYNEGEHWCSNGDREKG